MRTETVLRMYEAMSRAHGVRGWWPVYGKNAGPRDLPAYDPRRRRLSWGQRFEITVGAILTQNTAWTNVEKAMMKLHRNHALTPGRIRRMPLAKLARLIRSSGYFNQKAKKLKAWVRFLDKEATLQKLKGLDLATARGKLLDVNGIGPETADSILLYALEKPVFVVDAYTRRIFGRHGWIRGMDGSAPPYDDIRKWFERNLPASVSLFNDYHAQLVEIGKRYCRRGRPECLSCPLYRRGFFKSSGDFDRVVS